MPSVPQIRLSQTYVETAVKAQSVIQAHVRLTSPVLTTACRQAGLPLELAEMCGGLLASVIDDLIAVGELPRKSFERTKRKERILTLASEPQLAALRIAMAASPTNGRAAAAHWDIICDGHEIGKLAWLLGMDTENAYSYGKRVEARHRNEPRMLR